MGATVGQRVVAIGTMFTWPLIFEGVGSIDGATLTANFRKRGAQQVLLTDIALTITDADTRQADLTLTAGETANLIGDPNDPTKLVEHVCDVTMTLDGIATTYGPLIFNARIPT